VQTLSDIHDRNPVPLPRDAWEQWLDPTVVGDQGLVDWAVAEALPVADALAFRRVAPLRGDGPQLIEPA
jgi:putative SOS response-associated peptidase YedK